MQTSQFAVLKDILPAYMQEKIDQHYVIKITNHQFKKIEGHRIHFCYLKFFV